MHASYRPLSTQIVTALLATLPWCVSLRSAEPPPNPGAETASVSTLAIPGPLDSFLRMAAVSRLVPPEEVLPLLCHQVVVDGYGGARAEAPTEYLVLLKRYVSQARELKALAGPDDYIRVAGCKDVPPLLNAIGYRFRQPCGPNATLETADARRAFIAVDSGFPLARLEKALQEGKPFVYPYGSTQLPVLFGQSAWMATRNKGHEDLLDALLGDSKLARLYWALSQIDDETRLALRQSPGLQELLPFGALLDFYGEQLRIRSGRVLVPGGQNAESGWQHVVGESPASPNKFVMALLTKDDGWIAPYFDALARVSGPQQAYFTEPKRLVRFYDAFRTRSVRYQPARMVFRPDAALLLLVTRTPLEANGLPHVPGNLAIWSDVVADTHPKHRGRAKQPGPRLANPDELMRTLISLSREGTSKGPPQIYLAASEIDRSRTDGKYLGAPTVRLLAKDFEKYGDHYPVFAEFHSLDDTSISYFIRVAESVDRLPDAGLRAEARGIVQAQSGLWQILARQGQIPPALQNNSWQRVLHPFASVKSSAELYDASHTSLVELVRAATGKSQLSQDAMIELLAGPNPANPRQAEVRADFANRIRSVLDSQRLVSFDSLLALGQGLPAVARGAANVDSMVPFAEELREFEMPKPIFSMGEKVEWTYGRLGDAHTQSEMNTNVVEELRARGGSADLSNARGRLVPFLRDFLVGLNYAYYEPPAAQMIHVNALFIRRHDFSGDESRGAEPPWSTPQLTGRGDTSGGGVRLTGGLAGLPYALARVEQEFLVPRNVQSLVWEDLVPALMNDAVVARWWHVTPVELHAVALYQRFGEELLRSAAQEPNLRPQVIALLANHMISRRLAELEHTLDREHPEQAVRGVTPAEAFHVGLEFYREPHTDVSQWATGREISDLVHEHPEDTEAARLSEDFGIPHPVLAQSNARELLNLIPFPTFLGYSSYLLAESWESNNLYWARLADEKGLPPEALNQLVPMLTQRMVENIFGTHLDDWPALLRALRETGEEFEQGKLGFASKTVAASPL